MMFLAKLDSALENTLSLSLRSVLHSEDVFSSNTSRTGVIGSIFHPNNVSIFLLMRPVSDFNVLPSAQIAIVIYFV